MKKFVLFFIMINIINPSYAWFWDRKDKALDAELQGKGYAGTLPSLNLDLKPSEKKVVTPIFEVKKDFSDPKDLKPVPKNNPAFIDIITKKDKSSPYLTDIDEIIPIIEKLVSVIEEDEEVPKNSNDTLEKDLFNLIDSMYVEGEEEEDD